MKVRIGISLGPAATPAGLAAAVGLLESARIDSLWLSEVVYGEIVEPFTGMTYALATTSHLKVGTGVAVLGSTHAGRPGLAVAVSKDLTARVHAGDLVKELASIIDGSGGGPANSATGGGKDAARLGDALEAGARAVREKLGGRG